jgi:NitT/TauT family transport system permease protein
MTSDAIPMPRGARVRWGGALATIAPVTFVVLALIVLWYVAAAIMNAALVRAAVEQGNLVDLVAASWNAERPMLPAPHQILHEFVVSTTGYPPSSARSLLYHSGVTLSATLLGFAIGAVFGIVLAVLIVHLRVLE